MKATMKLSNSHLFLILTLFTITSVVGCESEKVEKKKKTTKSFDITQYIWKFSSITVEGKTHKVPTSNLFRGENSYLVGFDIFYLRLDNLNKGKVNKRLGNMAFNSNTNYLGVKYKIENIKENSKNKNIKSIGKITFESTIGGTKVGGENDFSEKLRKYIPIIASYRVDDKDKLTFVSKKVNIELVKVQKK